MHEGGDVGAVVEGGFFGEEARAGRGVVGVAEVGEDLGGLVGGGRGVGCGGGVAIGDGDGAVGGNVRVVDDADAEFIGRAFEAQGYHLCCLAVQGLCGVEICSDETLL